MKNLQSTRLNFFSSMRRKVLLVFLYLVSILLIVIGTFTYWQARQEMRERIMRAMERTTQHQANRIDTLFANYIKDVQVIADTEQLRLMNAERVHQTIAVFARRWEQYQVINIAGTDGHLVVSSLETPEATQAANTNVSDQEYFQKAIQGNVNISDTSMAIGGKELPLLVVAAPIVTNERNVGVVMVGMAITTIANLLTESRVGQTGDVYLISREGYFITPSRFSVALKNQELINERAELERQTDTLGTREALAGKTGVSVYRDYRGRMVVGAYAPIIHKEWGLLVEQDVEEAFAPVTQLRNVTLLIGLVFASVIAVFVFILNVPHASPLAKESSLELQDGNQDSPAKSNSAGEIGQLTERVDIIADRISTLMTNLEQQAVERSAANKDLQSALSELKHAKESLQESETEYRTLFDGVPVGLYQTTPAGQFLDVNQTMVQLLGYSDREALLMVNAADLYVNPEDREQWKALIEKEGSVRNFEFQLRRNDGTIIWLNKSARVVKDEQGQIQHYDGSLVDITDRKQAEEELQKNQELQEKMMEASRNEMAAAYEQLQREIENHKQTEAELQRNQELQEKMMEASRNEIAAAYEQLQREINEHKQTQEEMRILKTLADNAPNGIKVGNRDGVAIYVNASFNKMLGYESALGLTNEDITAPEELSEINRQIKENGIWQGRCRLKRKDESTFPAQMSTFRIYDLEGNPRGLASIIRDITEQIEWEEALRQAKAEADAANTAKSAFLATMSHEIRTPMNGVIGMASLLLDTELTREQRDFAETIRNSSDALLTIINDILDFSKIEAGRLELEQHPFNLRECVESALDLVAAKATEKGFDLGCLIEAHVPTTILSDSTRLRQIIVNLLSNAVKFTEEGEVMVSVNARQISSDGTPEEEKEKKYELHFAVKDTGIGIPKDRMDRLFQSFSQVDASTTRKYGGTGLGLTISKRLSEMMEGTMWVESEVGKGSTFNFIIQTQAAESAPLAYLSEVQPQLRGKRVLVVDDNSTNRKILRLQAQSWGMEPITVASGPEALELIRQGEPFDLALLDMQMPEMDGQTLAEEIRRCRDAQELPLIMLTSLGLSEPGVRKEFFAAFLAKPIKASQLYNSIVEVFAGETALWARRATERVAADSKFDSQMGEQLPLRILVAEDHPTNQKLALLVLGRLGYRADIASNGLEAVESVHRQPYDVVFMDVQMPEMDGLEATRTICQEWPLEQRPRIIGMSANVMPEDRETGLAAGMDDYVSKPIQIEELIGALKQCHPISRSTNVAQAQSGTAEVEMALPEAEPPSGVGFSSSLPERETEFPSWEGQGVGKKGSGKHEALKPTPNPSQDGTLATAPPESEDSASTLSQEGNLTVSPPESEDSASIPEDSPGPSEVASSLAEMLDPEALQNLRDMCGEDIAIMLPELIDSFFDSAPGLLDELQQAFDQWVPVEIRRIAHALKSSSATFGALKFSGLCRELENMGETGVLDEAAERIAQIKAEYDNVKIALESLCKEV